MSTNSEMSLKLKIWRQKDKQDKGSFKDYVLHNISPDISFLEMLDILNDNIVRSKTDEPIAFDHDCREGICGMCGLVINGLVHGPDIETTTCQLHMRKFCDGDTIVIEPLRAKAFPIVKDLVVDRSAFDRVIAAGGYVSVNTGNAPEANSIPTPKDDAEIAMDAAQCIGCGACVAACNNASAMLFVAAKVSQLSYLPQGKMERKQRVLNMIRQMDKEGFGNCTNEYECQAVCPKIVKVEHIAKMNREFFKAVLT